MQADTNGRISAEDLYRLDRIAGCEISPDGRHVAYCVERVDRETEKKFSNLWIAATDGGAPRQFTRGDQRDTGPQWSPDGGTIAFVSDRSGGASQIFTIPFKGGEARALTDLQGQFGAVRWSPDGQTLAVQFRKKDADVLASEDDERAKRLGTVYRHYTRVNYRADGAGYIPKERWHLWTIDSKSGDARQITDGEVFDETQPCWTPDGKSIVFISNRSEDPDFNPDHVDLWALPARGGEPRKIPTHVGSKGRPSVSPDGQLVAFVGRERRSDWWQHSRLWVVPIDGSRPPQNVTGRYNLTVSNSLINDIGGAVNVPPVWSRDGSSIYFHVSEHGNTAVKSIGLDGGDLRSVLEVDGLVGAFSVDDAEKTIAYYHGHNSDTGQIWTSDLGGGNSKKLTDVNQGWLDEVDLGRVEEVWFEGAAGDDLQGWIMTPPDWDPQQKYPCILQIHGGPIGQYGNAFMHEFQYLAANGYVVVYSNPRGGLGYGEEHTASIWNDHGGADYDDVMAWADFAAALPYIDEERMGVTGGSYGGFLVNWIVGHTDRFKAAVTQRSIFNRTSNYGTSDMNWIREETFDDEPPWVNPQNYLRQSPLTYIGNAKTPTLVIHSENDFRCPIEQGEQMFTALKRLGVDTEFVRFPEESHGLSRDGRTDRRIVRLEHMLRWFDKYLKV